MNVLKGTSLSLWLPPRIARAAPRVQRRRRPSLVSRSVSGSPARSICGQAHDLRSAGDLREVEERTRAYAAPRRLPALGRREGAKLASTPVMSERRPRSKTLSKLQRWKTAFAEVICG